MSYSLKKNYLCITIRNHGSPVKNKAQYNQSTSHFDELRFVVFMWQQQTTY
jgi:hypothetical protein